MGDLTTSQCDFTIDVDRAISRASIDEALCCCVYGREVGPDEGGQNPMAPVGHQAVVLGVPHIMRPCWIFLPSIVPATETLQSLHVKPQWRTTFMRLSHTSLLL